MFNLNNPYYMYPNLIYSEYQNVDTYNNEVIKLYNYIENYKSENNSLLSIVIGSPLEELKYFESGQKQNISYLSGNYWEQLFPIHIRQAIYDDINVSHIIISPSELFSKDFELGFIKNTKFMFEWKKVNNTYISENFKNITINIFNCPMPSKYDYNNFIKKIEKEKKNLPKYQEYQKKFIQTKDDIEFINNFYLKLNNLFDEINQKNGLITCLSYAVFNNDSIHKIYNNYNLFREITYLFNNNIYKDMRILAEWVFDKNNSKMYVYNTIEYKNYLISKKSFVYSKNIQKQDNVNTLIPIIYDKNNYNEEIQDEFIIIDKNILKITKLDINMIY